MENESISRAAKLPNQGAARYEDALRELRKKNDEEVQSAEKKYLKEGETFDQQRSEALKRTTELQRTIRGISPFQQVRERYEELSATELIEALHNARPIPDGYVRAKEAVEAAILDGSNGSEEAILDEFREARDSFNETMDRWQQNGGSRTALIEALDEKRRVYEQRLIDLEFENARATLSHGEHSGVITEYEEAHCAFEEAEKRCEEIRIPYEESIQRAQQNYEAKRQEYLRMVEQVREELDKAPDQYRQRFNEILENYNEVCGEEKQRVIAAGGLHILGTERHESRRIDNQLRGRAGRQGDPGSSRFYLSLEDDLMRVFGAERITGLMERLGMEEDVPIEHGMVNRSIENAQRRVEGHNFDIRKNLLDYDDVMNQQRKAIYALRKQILEGKQSKDEILALADVILDYTLGRNLPEDK